MRSFFTNKTRSKSTHNANNWRHPDLPLSPASQPSKTPKSTSSAATTASAAANTPLTISRSISVKNDRGNTVSPTPGPAGDRRSLAIVPSAAAENSSAPSPYTTSTTTSPEDVAAPSPRSTRGLLRSKTVLLRREGGRSSNPDSPASGHAFSPDVSPHLAQLPSANTSASPHDPPPTPQAPPEPSFPPSGASMSAYNAAGKTSSDSGQTPALDRWSQRRLQRLNTEQGFREQRQGGQSVLSPPPTAASGGQEQQASSSYHAPAVSQYPNASAQPQQQSLHHSQPHAASQVQTGGYQASRTAPVNPPPNVGLAIQTLPTSSHSRPQDYPPDPHHQQQQQFSSPDLGSAHYAADARPPLSQSRSFSQQSEESSSMSNNGALPAPKAVRNGNSNRQSVHNGMQSREGSQSAQGGQVPAFSVSVVPAGSQGQPFKGTPAPAQQPADVGRGTPAPLQDTEDMTAEDVKHLVKEHKELREKYTKVKKYYFEKEDQVKQLQNSLAHQRLSQSRTSLDDSEYTTRFNRLDGLVAQLAFSIRKSWKSIPPWLVTSVNKDAVATGKQEMTAAGRAVISSWLVEEVFDKYFHPDLDPTLSAQLKSIQRNMRKYAPLSQTAEEEENLTSKVVNWRLATLEGLTEALRSNQCPENRQRLTDTLKDNLVQTLAVHLQDPPPSDLEGGVHMIIELVVSIAIHLPLESRDVVIEYFLPGYSIMPEQMKLESGIPPLQISIADDAAERGSMKSATSDVTDMTENSNAEHASRKRSMLSALTGTSKHRAAGKHAGAGGSSSSLHRPESAGGDRDRDLPPRVRMAAGIGVSVRGRSILVKAPVFST